MALGIRGKITGMEPLRAKLQSLAAKVQKKVTRDAVKAGNKVFLAGVKSALHADDTGALRMSLGEKVQAYRGGAVQVGIIGPRTGAVTVGRGAKRRRKLSALGAKLAAMKKGPAYYAHLVEGGTAPHSLGKGSHRVIRLGRKGQVLHARFQVGRMHPGARAKPFVGPGYRTTEGAALAKVSQVLSDGVMSAATG